MGEKTNLPFIYLGNPNQIKQKVMGMVWKQTAQPFFEISDSNLQLEERLEASLQLAESSPVNHDKDVWYQIIYVTACAQNK